MKNLIEYLKDKIYYIMGATILLIVILVIISSCSGKGSSYSSIESKMVSAAKSYYASRENKLPKEDGSSIKVTIGTLIDAELIDEIKDPNNKEQTCEGFVQVKKVSDDYAYIPFLTCKGNYEPEYLVDKIKNSKLDEYGNGVYEMGGEYVYRGDDVNNYISFNNQTWRIVKVDNEGDIELIYSPEDNKYKASWDSKYNSTVDRSYGITTNYLQSDIRKSLVKFYDNYISDDNKAKIVKKDYCIGKKAKEAADNTSDECSTLRNEKIGLLVVSDYRKSSLDEGCDRYDKPSCVNRNYLAISGIKSWLLTTVSDNTYEAYFIDKKIEISKASRNKTVYPVVYLTRDTIIIDGNGSKDNFYKIK